MSEADWARFEALAESLAPAAPTQARAYGLALSALMHTANLPQPDLVHSTGWTGSGVRPYGCCSRAADARSLGEFQALTVTIFSGAIPAIAR